MKKKIIIVGGDPNSINSEIIFKAWKKSKNTIKKNLYLIANFRLFYEQAKKLKFKINLEKVDYFNNIKISNNLKIIDIPLKFKDPFKVSFKESEKYLLKSLNLAHVLTSNNQVKGMINCSINKKLIKSSKKIGVTEFLASKCNIKDHSEIMMIYNKKLSVVPITTHIKIKDISKSITQNLIITKIKSLNKNYRKIFKIKPKIGVLGLNPHNGEMSQSSEEKIKIVPAIQKLRLNKISIDGPLIADTLFINKYKKYDVIVGMYHDQVLAPFKTLFNFDAINITLGLNYLRVSPDHGPALDIIKKNEANYVSLLRCLEFINSKN